jgi:S-adenosylmethionine hydrolase
MVGTFGDLFPGDCAAVVGSFGQIEIVQGGGSAALALGAQRGTPLRVHRFE